MWEEVEEDEDARVNWLLDAEITLVGSLCPIGPPDIPSGNNQTKLPRPCRAAQETEEKDPAQAPDSRREG